MTLWRIHLFPVDVVGCVGVNTGHTDPVPEQASSYVLCSELWNSLQYMASVSAPGKLIMFVNSMEESTLFSVILGCKHWDPAAVYRPSPVVHKCTCAQP